MSKPERRQLHLDPTLCDAHGFCSELLPELIDLDEWGFPVLTAGGLVTDVPESSAGEAKRAVAACPVGALRLTKRSSSQGTSAVANVSGAESP